jgi:cyclopropane fatty-acyl-phospholipid synthase-like methyltransferase
MWLAHKLGLREGMRVLDVGCGVGGPMRTIARYLRYIMCNFLGEDTKQNMIFLLNYIVNKRICTYFNIGS